MRFLLLCSMALNKYLLIDQSIKEMYMKSTHVIRQCQRFQSIFLCLEQDGTFKVFVCVIQHLKLWNFFIQNILSYFLQHMKPKLKHKHIESFLQDIDDFQFGQKHKFNLEQHITPPDLAAKLLFYIYEHQPIEEYVVMDLGVGTGMLTCGLIYIESNFVLGLQIDSQYIEVAQKMLEEKVEGANYQLINGDIKNMKLVSTKPIDLVVMNPPFGTKETGIDIKFLQFAMKYCRGNIYSMHKSSTRQFIRKFTQEKGYKFELIMEVKFPLKKRFKKYHKRDVAYTQVDIIKLTPI